MPEYTPDERRDGLRIAHELDELAMSVATVRAELLLHSFALRFRREFKFSRPLKKRLILQRIQKEPLGLTITELRSDLQFHHNDLADIAKEMEAEGLVICKKVPPAGSKGGRPVLIVVPAPGVLNPQK